MPTATRRQAHIGFRNRHSAEQTIEVPSDALPTEHVDMDAALAENMEHEDQDQDIDEDESDEGIASQTDSVTLAYDLTQTSWKSSHSRLQA